MSTTSVTDETSSSRESYRHAMTVADFRAVVSTVPGDTPLVVGIRDHQRFNALLGDLAVHRASVASGPDTEVVVLDVEHLS